jgi:hypothetical protein
VTGVIDAAFERARGAAELLLGAATHIAPGWLAAGLALHLLIFVVMLAISLVLVGRELDTRSPREALRRARRRLALDANPGGRPAEVGPGSGA